MSEQNPANRVMAIFHFSALCIYVESDQILGGVLIDNVVSGRPTLSLTTEEPHVNTLGARSRAVCDLRHVSWKEKQQKCES
jgi:hypothetical protein